MSAVKKFCFPTIILSYCCIFAACNNLPDNNIAGTNDSILRKGTYGYDREFLEKNAPGIVELTNNNGQSKIIISNAYQGRVMTSTASGDTGISFGWLNYRLIASPEKNKQFNPIGGEERFWMGPEGGQYSIYFKGDDSFVYKNWKVPAFIDTDPFTIDKKDSASVTLSANAKFYNYIGTDFNLKIERTIQILSKDNLADLVHHPIPENLRFTGYSTANSVTNTGSKDWNKTSGLLSVWLLGMFAPTPQTYVIIPFKPGVESKKKITDNYFGEIPTGRLRVTDSTLIFYCDGNYRSKIGIAPSIAKPIVAAFDFTNNVFTIVIPQISADAPYVNSKWELQKNPYSGDVINAYNDGPLEDGSKMGPFFEIESSSPALELRKNATGVYTQTTCHFQGDFETLRQFALQLTGVDLKLILR